MFTGECLLSARYSITGFVCVTACEYASEKDGVCACLVICELQAVCDRVTGLYQSYRICFLPHCLSPSPQSNPHTPPLVIFSGKQSNPNLNWCCHCLLELRHSTNKYLNVIYKRKTYSYAALKPHPQYKPGLGGGVVLWYQYSW